MAVARPPAPASAPQVHSSHALAREGWAPSDRTVLGMLGALLVVLVALTWRHWGIIDTDTGLELTVADLIAHGHLAYRDVQYSYGPAGLYSLALAFAVFGSSMSTAIWFGLLQTVAILAVFYALARTWVRPLTAGLASAALIAIGLSGWANFVLPNTNSATFGLLFLLLALLALSRDRTILAGLAFGVLALTRIEFAAAGAASAVAYSIGVARVHDRRAALRALLRMAVPGILIALIVLGFFAERVGTSRLITQNLFPVNFASSEANYQRSLSPLSFASLVATLGRGLVYLTLLAGLLVSAQRIQDSTRRGLARFSAAWPLAVAVISLLVLDGALRVVGAFPETRSLIQTESKRLLLGMSWLPALILLALVLALARLLKRAAPLRSWPLDLALLAAAAVLALRAYDSFTTDTFAPYYAAPALILLAILHEQIGKRWRSLGWVSLTALALVVLSLLVALGKGTTGGQTELVRSARGSFGTTPATAPALRQTISFIDAHTRPGEPILSLPYGGLYFLLDRPPALYNLAFLPGDVVSTSDQQAAIAHLKRERVAYVVLGNARFDAWGAPQIGVNYDRLLLAYVQQAYRPVEEFGDFASRLGGPLSQAYRVYERRGA
jgi:hypothetical protein